MATTTQSHSAPEPPPDTSAATAGNADVQAQLNQFGAHYGYDVSYLSTLNATSATTLEAFMGAQVLGRVREALPLDAHFVARIATTLGDDCGACAQLNVQMALEAGVDTELLNTLLRAPETLPRPLRDVRDHAAIVTSEAPVDLLVVERLREAYGDRGLSEIAAAIVGSRIYPTMKRALGLPGVCVQPQVKA